MAQVETTVAEIPSDKNTDYGQKSSNSRHALELSYALYVIANTLCMFYYQNLLIVKAQCVVTTTSVNCDELTGLSFIAFANSWVYPPTSFCGAIYTVFAIMWSDKAGRKRKPLLLLSTIGLTLQSFLACWYSQSSRWSVTVILATQCLIELFFGGSTVYYASIDLYVTDSVAKENYTTTLGRFTTLRVFCLMIGNAVSGFTLSYLGVGNSFFVCSILSFVALITAFVFVEEHTHMSRPDEWKFWTLINVDEVKESVKVIVFRERNAYSKLILSSLLLIWVVIGILSNGESAIIYLFLRSHFKWSDEICGIYAAYRCVCLCVGVIICTMVLEKHFQFHDTVIGALVAISKLIRSVLSVTISQGWQIYVLSLLDMGFASSSSLTRSALYKLVDEQEHGHLAVVLSLLTAFYSIGDIAYDAIFSLTIKCFPTSVFLISAILSLIILFTFSVTSLLRRKYLTVQIWDSC